MQFVETEKFGPWGNQGATNCSLKLGGHETIKEVIISHGSIIDGIGFTVADEFGNTTTTWFGGHATETDKIVLRPNEYITQVSGTHAERKQDGYKRHISSLKIHTNFNPGGYGTYGLQKGVRNIVHFSSPMPLDGTITGFFGRAEQFLDSIGIYVNKWPWCCTAVDY